MKKSIMLFVIACTIAITNQSCNKMENEDKVVYQTVDATINANEVYTYSLPESKTDNAFKIASQASHFVTSELRNQSTVYYYKPADNYIGSDKIIVSTVEEKRNKHQSNGGGNCSNSQQKGKYEMVITINLTIKGVNTGTK